MGNRGKILIVDDDRFYQDFCREILEPDYEIHTTFTGQEALGVVVGWRHGHGPRLAPDWKVDVAVAIPTDLHRYTAVLH